MDTSLPATIGWTLQDWREAYAIHGCRPRDLLPLLWQQLSAGDAAWISLCSERMLGEALEGLEALDAAGNASGSGSRLPLFGVPYAVKDNIDVAGMPTTAGCPDFAYTPKHSAEVVRRLTAAGAICLGKTNLDQFATGLVGTRSPYGVVANAFSAEHICGGSSSGSAAVVAKGLLPFALGTDTAGSGRIPAGCNNLVGLKPSRGSISNRGVVPACRSLDCVSVFALTVEDAAAVLEHAAGHDPADPFSRQPRPVGSRPTRSLSVPDRLEYFGDTQAEASFQHLVDQLCKAGWSVREIDLSPFHELAALLYEGPWLAERYASLESLLADPTKQIDENVRAVVTRGASYRAADAFRALHRRAELKRQTDALLAADSALLVPTVPRHYRIEEVQAEPIASNASLGTYANFVNLCDACALSLPALFREDGLPFGATLVAPAWHEAQLIALGEDWEALFQPPLGATGRSRPCPTPRRRQSNPAHGGADRAQHEYAGRRNAMTRVAVVGAHLDGMPLNHQLTERGAVLIGCRRTAEEYRLYLLPGTRPAKPGLVREGNGGAIEIELWDLPTAAFGDFVAAVPSPLTIGSVRLDDGTDVKGFLCEPWATAGALDITAYGGWRAYLADAHSAAPANRTSAQGANRHE